MPNTPSSLIAPKRFFTARNRRRRPSDSPSKYSTVSTICSSTRGPASAPSLVTWPTRKIAVPLCLAKRTSNAALSRTWATPPGADCSCSVKMVWIESITITLGFSTRAVAMMLSMQVSVITLSLSSGKPKRRARMATCCWDSSPVTYSAGKRVAILHRVCSRMVDLPMPGSPPISTTDPSTRPPPSTRSSSPEAVEKRGTSSTLTSARVLICT